MYWSNITELNDDDSIVVTSEMDKSYVNTYLVIFLEHFNKNVRTHESTQKREHTLEHFIKKERTQPDIVLYLWHCLIIN